MSVFHSQTFSEPSSQSLLPPGTSSQILVTTLEPTFAGHQACSVPDDRTVCDWPGPRDIQLDREGAVVQAEDRNGASRSGKQDFSRLDIRKE